MTIVFDGYKVRTVANRHYALIAQADPHKPFVAKRSNDLDVVRRHAKDAIGRGFRAKVFDLTTGAEVAI